MANPNPNSRLLSLDAYRGFIMLMMASSGFGFKKVYDNLKGQGTLEGFQSDWWKSLAYQFDHVPWTGCAFWDLIQPSFMFMVGVAMPFSLAKRRQAGDSPRQLTIHAAIRAVVLVLLGVMLSSHGSTRQYLFTNVLAQIGLGYFFVFLISKLPTPAIWGVVLAITVGVCALFQSYPAAAVDQPDAVAAELTIDLNKDPWPQFVDPWSAHWNKHTNAFAVVDRIFLNWFPQPKEPKAKAAKKSAPAKAKTQATEDPAKPSPPAYRINVGGYATLNFLPSMITMLFGVLTGQFLLARVPTLNVVGRLVGLGILGIAIGMIVDHHIWPTKLTKMLAGLGTDVTQGFASPQWSLCPIVKRIWTPSWAIFSTGWCLLILALFYLIIEIHGWKRWAHPLVVVGANSIFMYLAYQLFKPWIRNFILLHTNTPDLFAGTYGPIFEHGSILLVLWLMCYYLYRQKLFFKI